jgi:hypothetical protein
MLVGKDLGYGREFDTRRPHSSVKKIVESFSHVGELEVGFIKERKAGRLVGASLVRDPGRTYMAYNPLFHHPRSMLHTHTIDPKRDPRIYTYPSKNDLHWIIDRLHGSKEQPPDMRSYHVMPMTLEGKAMGFSSVRIGKRWIQLEKQFPKLIEAAWNYYSTLESVYFGGSMSTEEYLSRVQTFFENHKKLGLQVRVTPYPGFKVENGFLVPKRE